MLEIYEEGSNSSPASITTESEDNVKTGLVISLYTEWATKANAREPKINITHVAKTLLFSISIKTHIYKETIILNRVHSSKKTLKDKGFLENLIHS